MSYLDDIWQKAQETLRPEINPSSYATWILPIEPVSLQQNDITLQVQNEAAKTILSSRYSSILQNAIKQITGTTYTLHFVLPGESVQKPGDPAQDKQKNDPFNPRYTFDHFVVGTGNQLAYAAALAVSELPAQTYNPLFIYGQSGLGKTHLLHAVGHFVHEQHPESNVLYVRAERFTNELIEAIQHGRNEEFRNHYRTVDVLMVDDIQFIAGKERTMEEFFHTFNALFENSKQIIITCDMQPTEVPSLQERLVTRFTSGLVVDIQPPDLETRVAILMNKAKLENVIISDEVLLYIAGKINSNIRTLEGALNRVVAYARLTNKREIDMQLAVESLKDIMIPSGSRRLTPAVITDAVSSYYNISTEDIVGKKKTQDLVTARHVAMWLCREMTDLSLPKIGDFFNRDHSTVVHAHDKVAEQLQGDTVVRSAVLDIKKRIQEMGY